MAITSIILPGEKCLIFDRDKHVSRIEQKIMIPSVNKKPDSLYEKFIEEKGEIDVFLIQRKNNQVRSHYDFFYGPLEEAKAEAAKFYEKIKQEFLGR